jgi:hypothetical protein
MLALNIAFPLLYWEPTPLITAACLGKIGLEMAGILKKKIPFRYSLIHLVILTLITNYIGFLLIFIPKFLKLSIPFLITVCPPPQTLPILTLLLSITLAGLLSLFVAKKVLSHPYENSIQIGACSCAGSLLMILAASFKLN